MKTIERAGSPIFQFLNFIKYPALLVLVALGILVGRNYSQTNEPMVSNVAEIGSEQAEPRTHFTDDFVSATIFEAEIGGQTVPTKVPLTCDTDGHRPVREIAIGQYDIGINPGTEKRLFFEVDNYQKYVFISDIGGSQTVPRQQLNGGKRLPLGT